MQSDEQGRAAACVCLASALRDVGFPGSPVALGTANLSTLVEILGWILTSYSPHVARWASDSRLLLRPDIAFFQGVIRLVRVHLGLRCTLTALQFACKGRFSVRKLTFVTDVIRAVQRAHDELEAMERRRARHTRSYRTIFHLEPGAASSDSCISSKYVDALAPSVLCDAVLPPQLYRRCAGPSAAVSSDRIYSHGSAGALPVAVHAWEFIIDAVATGRGASTSLAVRRFPAQSYTLEPASLPSHDCVAVPRAVADLSLPEPVEAGRQGASASVGSPECLSLRRPTPEHAPMDSAADVAAPCCTTVPADAIGAVNAVNQPPCADVSSVCGSTVPVPAASPPAPPPPMLVHPGRRALPPNEELRQVVATIS